MTRRRVTFGRSRDDGAKLPPLPPIPNFLENIQVIHLPGVPQDMEYYPGYGGLLGKPNKGTNNHRGLKADPTRP